MDAIAQFIRDGAAFEPQDIQAMSKALDEVCKALKIDADATAEEIVAIRIIELAGRGERIAWLHLPIGERFSARAAIDGCRVWIKKGHLRHVQAEQPTG
jgi:hypothetical protein